MNKFSTGRRQAVKTIGAALAASAIPAPFLNLRAQEHNFSGKTLRLLTWSDDTGTAALHNIAATFTAKTGAKVIADRADGTSGMVAKVKAAGDRPTYDVITLAGVFLISCGPCPYWWPWSPSQPSRLTPPQAVQL